MKGSYYLIERFSPENNQALLKEELNRLTISVRSGPVDLTSMIDTFVKRLVGFEEYELLITALMELAQETNKVSDQRFLLDTALYYAELFASWATSGGEGLARMSTVNEIKKSLSLLD